MSSFPKHVDNINTLKAMGFDVSNCYEAGEVTSESWGYDELVDLMGYMIQELKSKQFRLEGQNK